MAGNGKNRLDSCEFLQASLKKVNENKTSQICLLGFY
jgi:hypothetical protein